MSFKHKTIRIGNFQSEPLPFLITLVGIIFLCTLGFWQLARLKEKTAFIESISNNLKNPPGIFTKGQSPAIYQKIKLNGRFLDGKDIYLYGRKASAPDKEGYNLLSPFQTTTKEIIMVARGWFAAKNKALIKVENDKEQTEISGIILPLEKEKLFIPANDLKNNIWFTLEHKQMMDYAGQQLENFYMLQINPQNLPELVMSIDANNLIRIKNDHLEYALTWFSLAICLMVVFIVYNRSKFK